MTSGGMECIALLCQAMVDPGDTIAVEAPTYLGALMAFAGFEATLVEIPMDDDGLQVDVLAERLAARPAAEAPLRDPRLPEPDRPHAAAGAAAGADRSLPPPRRADPRGRRLPRDGVRRRRRCRRCGRWRPTSSCRRGRSRRSSRPASGSAGRSGRRDVIAQMAGRQADHRPVLERLRPADRRGVRPRRRASSRQIPAQPRAVRVALAGARGRAPAAPAGRLQLERRRPAASSPGSTLPPQLDAGEMRDDAVAAGVTYVPGARLLRRPTAVRTSCGCRSATCPRTTSTAPSSAWRRHPRPPRRRPGSCDADPRGLPRRRRDALRRDPHWQAWADVLGVPRLTVLGVLGGLAARGADHREVFTRLAPGVDLERAEAEMRERGLFAGYRPVRTSTPMRCRACAR